MQFFVPVPFSAAGLTTQEPKSTPDTPAGPGPTNPELRQPGPGPTPTGNPAGCGTEMWIMMPAMLLLMYFMVLRPEQKRRKEQTALLASIKQGDRIVTTGGMHGVVARMTDKTVTLRIDTIHATFDRVAIARVDRGEAPGEPK